METKKNIIFFFFFIGISITLLSAQNNTVVSGGNNTGAGGSISYSVGQVFYTTQIGSDNSILSQGLQHSFEIKTLSNEEFSDILLVVKVFPNPTVEHVVLKIFNMKLDYVAYELFNINGKRIQQQIVTNEETRIDMARLPSAIYILKVYDKYKELKSYRIIKH